jgi:hypothetical protein
MSDWKLLNTSTASTASNVSFTDLTGYKIFKFVCIDIFPSGSGINFGFQVNASGGSGFNETITSTFFDADHTETGTGALQYEAGDDQAQGTAYQRLTRATGGDADATCAGELFLFNPASTTYVKHFYGRVNEYMSTSPRTLDNFIAGYINTTTAITQIDFKFLSGTFDGVIKQYGLVAS